MSIHYTGLDFDFTPERVIRTHANIVLLHGDRAIKLKKPVKFPFLDYSTLALRRHNIQAEFDLNRRFSPDIYLGVCEVIESQGALHCGGLTEVLSEPKPAVRDYAVVMRRIPDDAWLPQRLERGLSAGDIAQLLRLLNATWRAHPPDDATRAAGMPENLRHNTVANIAECRRLVPACLSQTAWDRLDSLLRGWFEANTTVFEGRVRQDRIRDGHGDLKPSNIAFIDGHPVVTDCIEFNPQFRRLDTLAEAGFLATGMEQLGAFSTAAEVLSEYRDASGDEYPEALRRYYQAHLACVMGKVTALQLDDAEISAEQRGRATALARHNFALADFHAREPHMLLVGGVVGCGKSTTAASIAAHLGWPVISSDVLRKRRFGVAPIERLPQSAYSDQASREVYAEMFAQARQAGTGVILDAQFPTREFRGQALETARAAGGTATFVLCDAPDDVVRERLRKRELDPSSVSDAGVSLLQDSRQRFEPPKADEGLHLVSCDTARASSESVASVVAALLGPDFNPQNAR